MVSGRGRGVLRKMWDHKKEIVEPLGFAMIPHMAVSNYFFLEDIFLLQEMPFGFRVHPQALAPQEMFRAISGLSLLSRLPGHKLDAK